MIYPVGIDEKEIDLHEGDKVEIVIRSSLYCAEGEKVIYPVGTITELEDNGIWMKYDKDQLYEQDEEELFSFDEPFEYIHHKKYEIFGYASHQKELILSVKGQGVGAVIRFAYVEGSLKEPTIQEGDAVRPVTPADEAFIREVLRYGMADTLFQHVMEPVND